MANTQINIARNGTTTLLTAGKYCDKNIDVNVDVSGGPARFTNILDLPSTIVKEGYRVITDVYSETIDGVAVVAAVTAGTHQIRVRGKWAFWFLQIAESAPTSGTNARTNVYFSTTAPTDEAHGGTLIFNHDFVGNGSFNVDAYGDWYMTATVEQNGYIGFSLKDMSAVFPDGIFSCEPIVTIDEPIGCVEVNA